MRESAGLAGRSAAPRANTAVSLVLRVATLPGRVSRKWHHRVALPHGTSRDRDILLGRPKHSRAGRGGAARQTVTPELAIFDFDGTLADSLPWYLEVFDRLAESYDFKKLDRGALAELRHLDVPQLLARHGIPMWKVPFIIRHARLLLRADIGAIKLFPGVETALCRLDANGVVLGILTSNSRENVRRVLGPETASLFRYWECGSSVFGKSAKLRELVRNAAFARDAVIFVGDEIRDADAARAARVRFGAVAWGFAHLKSLASDASVETFAHPAELATKLLGKPPAGQRR